MTCYDCIHCDACSDAGDSGYSALKEDASKCKHFKNKADFEEVVRCKDCRFNVNNMERDGYDTTDYSGEDIVCSYFMTDGMLPTDFCSYGERAVNYESSKKVKECKEKNYDNT